MDTRMKFEFLEHTGDIKFKAYGKNLDDLFENSVLAISSVFSRGKKISDKKKREITIRGKDYESLLYKFLGEIIYLFDADNFIVSKAKVKLTDKYVKGEENTLTAILYGDDTKNYKDLDAVKSPTYAEMYVKKEGKNFVCQVVLDV
ncbi:MAG: archease [Candidatus Pacearchaeota archaeon]